MTQEQSLLRYPRGPEGGKNQIEDHTGYLAEIDLETSTATTATGLVTSIVTSEATTIDVRPGRSASQSPGSDFPEEIFGVDEPQSVETSGLQLFETLDHDELGSIANMEDTELNTPTIEFAPSEQIFPEMKEITQANITDIWNATDNIENLSCVNPMEIEGMEAARDILEAPIYFADQETTIEEAPVISIPEERPRKKLRLIMPKPEPAVVTTVAPTTPEVLETFERSLQKNSEESIDLLAYVTDSTIKVDDPAFLAFIGNTTPGVTEEVSKQQQQPPKGKRLSAKRAKAAVLETPVDHAYAPPSAVPSTSSSTGDRSVAKYRRMRDLNNEASKRCRQNRKRKQSDLEAEAEALQKRNVVLKARCRKMEELVDRMKKQFLKRIAKPQTPLDLDKIMADRLAKF